MNDNIARSQLLLTRDLNIGRLSQLNAVKNDLARLNANTLSLAGRAYFLTARYLNIIATSLAIQINHQVDTTLADIKKLQDLPDDIQWEFRIAHTLGVIEGVNNAGALLSQILEKIQSAMYKAALLDLCSENHLALPVHQSGHPDELYAFAAEAEGRQLGLLKGIWQLSHHLCQAILADATSREETASWTIASISSNAGNYTAVKLLAQVNDTISSAFADNAASLAEKHDYSSNHKIARMKAAAIVSGLISTILQRNLPWTAINLN